MFEMPIDFQPGINDPSPVTRVLILGYYDGPTNGVLRLGDGARIYRFDRTDEDGFPVSTDGREFQLRPLPPESWDRLVAIIGEHIPPSWPNWAPLWRFPSPEIQRDVESEVDAILDRAGGVEWEIATYGVGEFGRVIATPSTCSKVVAA